MKTQSFHNTVNLTGDDLKKAIQRAAKQEEAILLLFMNWRRPMSPSKVWDIMIKAGKNWPITSCRRAISNLCRSGHLIMNGKDKMVKGLYNELEHTWQINAVKYPSTFESEQTKLFNDKAA